MKYSLLFTLLISAPLLSASFREAQTELDAAQGRVNECKSKLDNLSRRVDDSHKATESLAGKYEYSDDMESRRKNVRTTIEEYNKAVQEFNQATQNLQKVISKVGRNFRLIESNDSYSVMEPEKQELEPIITKARPSHERMTKTYSSRSSME